MNFLEISNNETSLLIINSQRTGELIALSGIVCDLSNRYNNLFIINDNLSIYSNLNIKGYSTEDIPSNYNNKFIFNINEHVDLLNQQLSISSICNYIFNNQLEYVKPIINLSEEELSYAQNFKNKLDNNKKILIIHPFASGCLSGNYDPSKKSFRDYFTRDLISRYKDTYNILQIHNKNQHYFSDTISLADKELREIFSIISIADKIISCDTMTQHAAAALNIKALVLWSVTNEKIYGHPLHKNFREFELFNNKIDIRNKNIYIPTTINMFTEKTFTIIEDYLNE